MFTAPKAIRRAKEVLDEAQAAQEQLEADGVDETSITEFGQGETWTSSTYIAHSLVYGPYMAFFLCL